jgi:hypothetical protein
MLGSTVKSNGICVRGRDFLRTCASSFSMTLNVVVGTPTQSAELDHVSGLQRDKRTWFDAFRGKPGGETQGRLVA